MTVVHVDDLGRPVVGGFEGSRTDQPAARSTATPPGGQEASLRGQRGALAAAAAVARRIGTVAKWAVVAVVCAAVLLMVLAVMATRN